MKLGTSCPICMNEFVPNQSQIQTMYVGERRNPVTYVVAPPEHLIEFEVEEESVYKLTCSKGHKFFYIYPEVKFELLFTSGLSAFYDGHYREAVSSIATSVERFHEFAIKVICEEKDVSLSEIGNTWSIMKSQSERQYGAFLFMYLLLMKKTSPKLSNGKIEFRNGVIHKGDFPNKEKTMAYIDDCLEIIRRVLTDINTVAKHTLKKVYDRHTNELKEEYKKKPDTWLQTSTCLSLVTSVTGDLSFPTVEDIIKQIESNRKVFGQNSGKF